MKKASVFILTIFCCSNIFSQKALKETLLSEVSSSTCNCIDSIKITNKSKKEIAEAISTCIDKQAGAYQLGAKLFSVKDSVTVNGGNNQIDVSINIDKNSNEYRQYYFEMERYLMKNCTAIKAKIAADEKENDKSVSSNPKAMELYTKGIKEAEKENHKKAIDYFESALKIDDQFAFAWDNLGLSYRKLGNYEKALEAYKKSIEIDPKGAMPLQNIAIVYQYQKEYQKAIESYQKLIDLDKNNPEIYYGIGQVYAFYLKDYEKALDNMCKAYNLYIEQKSPYRTDAESIINTIYSEMKKIGKEAQFNKILKANNIASKD
jgi:tetratricopeptide (TPR) repeat protein